MNESVFYTPAGYAPCHFNALPLFSDALRSLIKERIQANDVSNLRILFRRYNVHSTFGLIMLHRHFDLQSDEKVVEFRGLSTPWKVADSTEIFGGKIVPRSWAFSGDGGDLRPIEFRFESPADQPIQGEPVFPNGFVREFYEFLSSHGLENLLGLTIFDSVTGFSGVREVERTIGRVSIMLPASDSDEKHRYSTETAWSFGCHERMDDSKLMNARICWVCLDCSNKSKL